MYRHILSILNRTEDLLVVGIEISSSSFYFTFWEYFHSEFTIFKMFFCVVPIRNNIYRPEYGIYIYAFLSILEEITLKVNKNWNSRGERKCKSIIVYNTIHQYFNRWSVGLLVLILLYIVKKIFLALMFKEKPEAKNRNFYSLCVEAATRFTSRTK